MHLVFLLFINVKLLLYLLMNFVILLFINVKLLLYLLMNFVILLFINVKLYYINHYINKCDLTSYINTVKNKQKRLIPLCFVTNVCLRTKPGLTKRMKCISLPSFLKLLTMLADGVALRSLANRL